MDAITFNDEITVPTSGLVHDYSVADNMVTGMVETHSAYWTLIKACQRHIQGEKPNDPKELRQKGLAWVWNFNFGKARAKIEKGTAENISRTSSAIALGHAGFREAEEEDKKDKVLVLLTDENLRGLASSAIGYSLTTTLAKETRLSTWLNTIEYNSYSYGYCCLSHDPHDWIPEPIPPLNIAFPKNTKAEEVNSWVTFGEMKAIEVYQRWAKAKNEKTKREREGLQDEEYSSSGWNCEALEEVLARLYRDKINGKNDWKVILPLYTANPNQVISNTDSLQIAKLHYVELDGTLTIIYIPYSNPWQVENKSEGEGLAKADNAYSGRIIYKKNIPGKFDQKKNILFVRDSGFSESGFVEDFRGIAKYSVEDSIRYNRVRNNIGNKSIFIGAPTFMSPNGQVSDRFKVTVQQPFVVYNAQFVPMDKQPTYDIASSINLLRFEEGEYLRDTQQFDATVQGRLSSRPNKGEVEQISQEVQFTNNAKSTIKYRDYSTIFCSVVQRIPELRLIEQDAGYAGLQSFFKSMKKMLPEYLKTDDDVRTLLKAVDSYVIEPVLNNTQAIMFSIQTAKTPFARNRYERMLALAQGFPIEEVNIMIPLIIDKFTNFQDTRIALFENDMFWTTSEVIAQKTDDQIIHLDAHIEKDNQVIQGLSEGRLTPKDAAAYLSNSLQHIMVHMNMLGEDPVMNSKAQDYLPAIKQINQARQQASVAARQQLEAEAAQANQVQIDPETQNKIASSNAKAISDQQRKDWLAQDRARQREQQIENTHLENMRELELKYATKSI